MGATTASKYAPNQHIPGLNVGGWFDPSDDDLDTAANLGTIQNLALAFKEFGINYDTLTVDADQSSVELHRVDHLNDMQQQVKQGILQILGQIDNVGFVFKGLKVPTLKQYSQSGDPSKNTDGLTSGDPDDRLAFVGDKDVALQFDAAAALASASYVLAGFDDDLAARSLKAAQHIWDTETVATSGTQVAAQNAAKWNAAVELLIATNGNGEAYKAFLRMVRPMSSQPHASAWTDGRRRECSSTWMRRSTPHSRTLSPTTSPCWTARSRPTRSVCRLTVATPACSTWGSA